jgi:formate dehydrogenase alpha subunit
MGKLTINDRIVEARKGQTILEAARLAGIMIPTLCYHKDLSIAGSCRLCLVEIEQLRAPAPACATPVVEGMIVRTETPALIQSRRLVLEMLLRHYADARDVARDRGDTEFLHWVKHYGARPPEEIDKPAPRYPVNSDANPFVWVDLNKCILCTRCVRACEEVQGRFVWGVGYRGSNMRIVAGVDTDMLDARCESCGACAAYCPTGALDDKMAVGLGKPDKVVASTCGYCGVGCGFHLNVKDGRVVRVTSNPEAAVNGMSLCVKGRYGYDFVHHPERLTQPRVRRYLIEGAPKALSGPPADWIETDWETALSIAAGILARIKRESGSDAIGVLASAKCTNEENYLMQKFARQVIGTHNVDHCARLCHSSTVAGLAMAFGSGAMSNSMDDIAGHAAAAFLIGSNVTEQHPVFGAMIRQAVLRRDLKLVVADPRKIDITEFALLHLRHKPGTDVALLNGLMCIIVQNNWHDTDFISSRCEGFDEFRAAVEKYPPARVADITGVTTQELHRAAEVLAVNRPMAVIWAMGITQHTTGVLNVLSLANLQMLLGNMGVAGGGVNPLRGQNNVQGACDIGALPNVLPGYQPVTDPAILARFSATWALAPAARGSGNTMLGNQPGLTATEMVREFGARSLRGLYVLGEDLALTEPDLNHARHCLAAGEFLVLQEIFPSETSQFADILLPGAAFAEKAGTFTNTERRVQLVRPAVNPPGAARQDWAITAGLACRLLGIEGQQPTGAHAGWDYPHPERIFAELASVTPSYAGVSYARLDRGERLQWPVPSADHPGTPILHVGRFTRGKGKFHVVEHLPPAELPDKDFPLLLTTGRVLYHWHGGELTRRAKGLLEMCPEALVEVNPVDAIRVGIRDRGMASIRSRRGEMVARALITERVAAGVLFGNFHFPGVQNVNNVTSGATDPVAKIPEYKVCAVNLRVWIPDQAP